LAASIWTTDREHAYHLSRKIEAGSVFVNSLVRSDSEFLWWNKKIRIWRELGAIGIKEFMNAKSLMNNRFS
jgi:succinate-semialdehyde dehydrogenase/glutarate-semialdehyde dehydrogenase